MTILCLTSTTVWASTDFPGRKVYPKVPVYELAKLNKDLDKIVIVDARSAYEFNTLHVKSAINVPVASDNFLKRVKEIAQSKKTVVFYCNGRSCYKSYIAAKKSIAAGIRNVAAFDAGIFEWAVANPDKTVLLGQSPINIQDLISSKKFDAHLLTPDDFSDKISELGTESMVLDVRDMYQRAGVGFYPGKERWVSLDNQIALEKFLSKAKDKKKTLFIYDEVGKQVRWLQYALEKYGIKNYFFMKKGAKEYYAQLMQ